MITLRIKVWKRLEKVAPGRVRKGDAILVVAFSPFTKLTSCLEMVITGRTEGKTYLKDDSAYRVPVPAG